MNVIPQFLIPPSRPSERCLYNSAVEGALIPFGVPGSTAIELASRVTTAMAIFDSMGITIGPTDVVIAVADISLVNTLVDQDQLLYYSPIPIFATLDPVAGIRSWNPLLTPSIVSGGAHIPANIEKVPMSTPLIVPYGTMISGVGSIRRGSSVETIMAIKNPALDPDKFNFSIRDLISGNTPVRQESPSWYIPGGERLKLNRTHNPIVPVRSAKLTMRSGFLQFQAFSADTRVVDVSLQMKLTRPVNIAAIFSTNRIYPKGSLTKLVPYAIDYSTISLSTYDNSVSAENSDDEGVVSAMLQLASRDDFSLTLDNTIIAAIWQDENPSKQIMFYGLDRSARALESLRLSWSAVKEEGMRSMNLITLKTETSGSATQIFSQELRTDDASSQANVLLCSILTGVPSNPKILSAPNALDPGIIEHENVYSPGSLMLYERTSSGTTVQSSIVTSLSQSRWTLPLVLLPASLSADYQSSIFRRNPIDSWIAVESEQGALIPIKYPCWWQTYSPNVVMFVVTPDEIELDSEGDSQVYALSPVDFQLSTSNGDVARLRTRIGE